ncbi:hypothetical protein G4B88_009153 [Cannabis sativa]|uniref:NAC domain-containing protein n=2 Tax=Cannabis sativa TaxID=3483 RepID=A0A7J6G2D2_CANSA|nr:hypothetical protein G4B88_009153 [Cannabis sativa]
MVFSDDHDCPPGFRFYPTDEELVLYYLKRKICGKKLRLNVIGETDVYKFEPEELPGMSILKTGDRQWFFFSPRDRKHPNGARSNRGTKHGYWKATGKNRSITSTTRSVGVKKTLVFYKGHAPQGERTDWVMHEYTLDEEELKRCQNLQDYYALYKVFKKSGLGPKNGEQYGAPFREEEWNADCPDFNRSAIVETPVERVDGALSNVESQETIVDSQKSLSDEIEELLQQMTDEPLLDLPEVKDYADNTPPQSQVLSNNDMQSNLVDSHSREISFEEPVDSLHASGVQHNVEANFEHTQSDISQLQFHVPSEVAFSLNIHEQEVYVLPVEDFIEMDDLFGPEPTTTDAEKPLENFQFEEVDGLSELDLFHDATMFLNDMGVDDDRSRISHQYVHSLEQNVVNSYQYRRNSEQVGEDEDVSQLLFEVADQNTNLYYLQGSDQHTSLLHLEGTGQVNNHMYLEGTDPINNLLYQDIANQMNHQYQFQPDNQERSVFTSAEFDAGSHPNSSSVCDTSTLSLQPTQNQSGNDNSGNNSWFSSTLWSFVESIPTTPASAAENALVNRAFERMSSFSRLRINAAVNATTVPAGSDSETVKSPPRNRGFIFFPVLVIVIAILWVVLGTVKLWGSSSSNSTTMPFSDDQDCPPGFRFYPTDEELVLYYLKGKICGKRLRVNVIGETDVYKFEPEELPGMSILKTGDRQWFFFSPRDRKHPNGSRSNRGTKHGYWKVTGKNRSITSTTRSVGVKKTLVFYKGHAPKGERTDWVMHEYTLDEEELKRCQNLQDYYALYKVFKKSGLGPKNGEQYGAPFREEEWNADCPDFNRSAIVETPVERVDEALSNVESQETIVDSQKSLSDEIEELLQQMTDEPLLDLPEVKDYANNTPPQSQVLSNNDMQSNLVDSLSREISFEEPVDSFHVSGVQNNVQANFEHTHSDISQLQFHVPSEVAFSPNIYEQEVYVLPVEDFIEMDDLFGPEPTTTDAEKPLENFQFEEVDGLSELDLFHDATMFLNDIGADDDQSRISHQYVHSLEQNVVNSYQYRRSSEQVGEDEVVSQLLFEVADQNTNLYYLQGSDQHTSLLHLKGTGQVNNQMYLEGTDPINNLLYQDIANQMNHQYQFQPDNQERSAFNSAEFDPGSHPDPSSVCDTSTFSLQPTQNQSGNDNNGNNSWFSSTLWSFVESIPTTPASAAENALVNRAFERMSSFSRLRINAAVNATTVPAGSDSETVKSSLRNRGFIFFPILVVIIAILWVVLGTVKLWGSSSSNSSSIAS